MRILCLLVTGSLGILMLFSCKKEESFPSVPQIAFVGFKNFVNPNTHFTDSLYVTFSFQDGDGDIGIKTNDVAEKELVNLFDTLYSGNDKKINPDIYGYRVPYVEPTGNNKSIKGTITISFPGTTLTFLQHDTIDFHFVLKDRAFHKSNLLITPKIIIN